MADKSGADGGLRELALFAGAGGGILGGHLLGWRTVCAVEYEPYAAGVLIARQNEGILPPFPIWDDVRTFDGNPWRGIVDVVSGGFPCQDISSAGKGAGIDGERSGLWTEMARIIGEVRPKYAFIENSPMLRTRGLHQVLKDLAEIGYNAEWGIMGAADVGAPHKRDRLWILAHPNGAGTGCIRGEIGNENRRTSREHVPTLRQEDRTHGSNRTEAASYSPHQEPKRSDWWATEPDVGRVAHGVAARVDRLKAIGNGQVPAVAATAFMKLIAAQRGEGV